MVITFKYMLKCLLTPGTQFIVIVTIMWFIICRGMTEGSLLLITLHKGHSQSLTCCPSSGGCIAPASGVFHTRISGASSDCTAIISWVNTRIANSCSFYWEESIWRELTGLPSQPRKTSETKTRSAVISQARYSKYFIY